MASTAISAQGSTVSIGTTTGSAINITAVALTNPCRVTLASATGLNKGDVLTIAGVVGTTQLNGNNYVIQYIEPTTKIVTLAALDATGTPQAARTCPKTKRPLPCGNGRLVAEQQRGSRRAMPQTITRPCRNAAGGRGCSSPCARCGSR